MLLIFVSLIKIQNMKKFSIALFIASLTLFNSCGKDSETISNSNENDSTSIETPIVDGHNAQNSLDYEGIYEGVLPCIKSDCKEIELSLELKPDGFFIYSTKRVGVDKEAAFTTGTFHFEEDGNTIALDQIANVPNSFFIAEGKIYQLDKNQQKIEGPDAEKFILKKK